MDDKRDAVDMDAARGNVGRDEGGSEAVTEGREGARAHRLRLASVEGTCRDALRRELVGKTVDACLGADEEDGAALACADLRGDLLLVCRMNDEDVVVHRLDRGLRRGERVTGRVLHVGADECIDVTVEGRAEQEPLAARTGLVEELANDRHEPHVGHLVSLIENGDGDLREVDGSTVDEVLESARGGNEDVDAAVEGLYLLHVGHAADDEPDAKAACIGERGEAVAHLHCEFTGRDEDEAVWLLRGGAAAREAGEHRKAEGEGLA